MEQLPLQSSFDPYIQNATILAPDGITSIAIPIPEIDLYNDSNLATSANYGAQLGATVVMLFVVLFMTPSVKLRRLLTILHISGLVISIVRMSLLYTSMHAHANRFYETWGQDYGNIPASDTRIAVVATTFSMVQVAVAEAALMSQAWTMVAFWPPSVKYTVSITSVIVTLLTLGSRFALVIIQNRAIITLIPPVYFSWGFNWAIIMNAASIFWFCAIFNAKLLFHMISNRGILPNRSTVTPIEVLIMANGVLMLIPSVFAGLEWSKGIDFEVGSLAVTSVVIILPLGSLAAQRISASSMLEGSASSGSNYQTPSDGSSTFVKRPFASTSNQPPSGPKSDRYTDFNHEITSRSHGTLYHEGSISHPRIISDPIDLELSQIDRFASGSTIRNSLQKTA